MSWDPDWVLLLTQVAVIPYMGKAQSSLLKIDYLKV